MPVSTLDPTRTISVRRRFRIAINRQIKALVQLVQQVVREEDAFGLDSELTPAFNTATIITNQRWRFSSLPEKVKAFTNWFDTQVQITLMGANSQMEWKATAMRAFQQGIIRSYNDVMQRDRNPGAIHLGPQFLNLLIRKITTQEIIQVLIHQIEREIQSLGDRLSTQLARIATNELGGFPTPTRLTQKLVAAIRGSEKNIFTIANTETIRLYTEGQLCSLTDLSETMVNIQVEYLVTGQYDKACPVCLKKAKKSLLIEKAHGVIPMHPNCRCCFIPAPVGTRS